MPCVRLEVCGVNGAFPASAVLIREAYRNSRTDPL
jgi:hypothetical protein